MLSQFGSVCADTDDCASSPCQNGGVCTDAVNSYSCACVAGYDGTNCETDVDECDQSPCDNGGTCTDAVNSYSCACVAGYDGTNCEIPNLVDGTVLNGYAILALSIDGQLAMISRVTSAGAKVPVARTYDGLEWESAAHGSYTVAVLEVECWIEGNESLCGLQLPPVEGSSYVLNVIAADAPSDEALAARFLISTTFGPTYDEIQAFAAAGGDRFAWIEAEMQKVRAHTCGWHHLLHNPAFLLVCLSEH